MNVKILNFRDIPDKDLYVRNFNDTFARRLSIREYTSWYESDIWNKPTQVVAVFTDAGEMVSAAVLFYQRIHVNMSCQDVAIMCGAWTLPKYRGCGHMRKMIAATVEHLPSVGAHYMCGFGLMSNVSARFEIGAGAQIIPVFYANGFCSGYENAPMPTLRQNFEISEIFNSFNGDFIYTPEQFKLRYVPNKNVKCYDLPSGDCALLEETPMSYNLNFMSPTDDEKYISDLQSLSAMLQKSGTEKKLFVFESSSQRAAILGKYSFDIKAGYFSMLPVAEKYRKPSSLKILMGDRQ